MRHRFGKFWWQRTKRHLLRLGALLVILLVFSETLIWGNFLRVTGQTLPISFRPPDIQLARFVEQAGPLINLLIAVFGAVSTIAGVNAAMRAANQNRSWLVTTRLDLDAIRNGDRWERFEGEYEISNAGNSPAESIEVHFEGVVYDIRREKKSVYSFSSDAGFRELTYVRRIPVLGAKDVTRRKIAFASDSLAPQAATTFFASDKVVMAVRVTVKYRDLTSSRFRHHFADFIFHPGHFAADGKHIRGTNANYDIFL